MNVRITNNGNVHVIDLEKTSAISVLSDHGFCELGITVDGVYLSILMGDNDKLKETGDKLIAKWEEVKGKKIEDLN